MTLSLERKKVNAIYEELKGWQSAIGSLLGFVALMLGALWNFHLNRKRDAALRKEEGLSVTVAIYSEIVQLRREAATLAKLVSSIARHSGHGEPGVIKIDEHFLEAHAPTEPSIYKALASKVGLLSVDVVLPIAEFYRQYEEMRLALPLLIEKKERGYDYGFSYVLKPARSAVHNIVETLKRIEGETGIKSGVEDLDLGFTDLIIDVVEEAG